MQLPQFLFKVELPTNPIQVDFGRNWAKNIIEQTKVLPKYTDTGMLVQLIHFCISEAMRMYQHATKPDELALQIAVAKLLHRALVQPHTFELKLKLENCDNTLFIAPCNLASLVFIRGLEHVPRGLKANSQSWESKQALYSYTSTITYSVKEK